MTQRSSDREIWRRLEEIKRENRVALQALERRRARLEEMARLSERIVERAVRQLRAGR